MFAVFATSKANISYSPLLKILDEGRRRGRQQGKIPISYIYGAAPPRFRLQCAGVYGQLGSTVHRRGWLRYLQKCLRSRPWILWNGSSARHMTQGFLIVRRRKPRFRQGWHGWWRHRTGPRWWAILHQFIKCRIQNFQDLERLYGLHFGPVPKPFVSGIRGRGALQKCVSSFGLGGLRVVFLPQENACPCRGAQRRASTVGTQRLGK